MRRPTLRGSLPAASASAASAPPNGSAPRIATRSRSATGSVRASCVSSETTSVPRPSMWISPPVTSRLNQSQSRNSPPRKRVVSMRSTRSIGGLRVKERALDAIELRMPALGDAALGCDERSIFDQRETETQLEQGAEALDQARALAPEEGLSGVEVPHQIHSQHVGEVALAQG